MKALDRSVETLGLWIVTSSVTFINLQTRVASNYVWHMEEFKTEKGQKTNTVQHGHLQQP